MGGFFYLGKKFRWPTGEEFTHLILFLRLEYSIPIQYLLSLSINPVIFPVFSFAELVARVPPHCWQDLLA
jgi:hypothetical protein